MSQYRGDKKSKSALEKRLPIKKLLQMLVFSILISPGFLACWSPPRFGEGEVTAINITDYGALGDADFFDDDSLVYYSDKSLTKMATDSTDAINAAINHAVETGIFEVFIPPGTYLIRTVGKRNLYDFEHSTYGGIQMRSGITLTMSKATTLVMNPTDAPGYAFIAVDNQEDVVIRGGKIKGDRLHHIGDEHNYCYGINIANASQRVLVEDIEITDCEDDGIMIVDYHESLSGGRRADSIIINRVNSHHNGRQGLTISTGSNIVVRDSDFSYQTKHAPRSGIDIELESYDHQGVHNVEIINNRFIGNSYAAVIISDMFNEIEEGVPRDGALSSNIRIHGNIVEAIQLGLYNAGMVDGLEISNNVVDLTYLEPANCVALATASDWVTNASIRNNRVNSDSTVKHYTVGVLSISDNRVVISGNILIGQDTGIALSGDGAEVCSNVINDFQGIAINVWDGEHTIRSNDIGPRNLGDF